MKLFVRNVVLPNVCRMVLAIGYIVVMFIYAVPQMDLQHSKGDAFVVMMGVLVGFYRLTMPIVSIVDAYIEKRERGEKKQFLKELDEAPDYVKENTMCYFWHNTSACTKCPKKDCKAREPRELPPKITNLERIDPNEKAEYLVRICDYYTIAIPNPKTKYKLFCDIIRRIGRGEYKKLFFPKENPPVLDDEELENFRKTFNFPPP